MSMFKRLFGKGDDSGKAATPPPPPRSTGGGRGGNGVTDGMEKLDTTIDLLDKREAVLDKKIAAELEKAKVFMAKKNKNAAMQCMKRKKMYEDQIMKIAAQKQNMETMKFAMQEQSMNVEVLTAQRTAAQQMRQMNRGMDAETVEEERDILQEQMEEARNVTEVLTQPLDTDPVDEDELMDELEAEMGMGQAEQQAAAPQRAEVLPDMGPSVPTGSIKQPVAATTEDDDAEALRKLEEELYS